MMFERTSSTDVREPVTSSMTSRQRSIAPPVTSNLPQAPAPRDPCFSLLRPCGSDRTDSLGAVVPVDENPAPPALQGSRSQEDQVDALSTAALELNPTTMTTIIATALRNQGVVSAWTDVFAPALRRRGEQFEQTANGIAAEHLLSECLRAALSSVTGRRRRWTRYPPVLLAAPDGEQHVLPLQAMAAALAQAHRHSVLLGASVPPQALLDAAARLDPTVIFLWAHTPDTARRAELAELRRHLHASTLVLGGPGWPTGTANRVDDLASAVHACTTPHFPSRHAPRRRPGLASARPPQISRRSH
jgi:hypothetical protein